MTITLEYSATTLTLHEDLNWSDELNWHPVEQTATRSVTGALVIQTAARISGRPITLQPIDDSSAWMIRSTLDTLISWAAVPGRQMTLTINGTDYEVIFRHEDGPAVAATPVIFYNNYVGADYFLVTLKFTQVS